MAKTETVRKSKTQQARDAELGLIIDEFGRAMWNAFRPGICTPPICVHDTGIHFTMNMRLAWSKYVEFCRSHPE